MNARRRKPLAAAVAILAVLMLLPAAVGLILSLFLFDAPGAETSPLTSALATSLWVAPLVLATSLVLAIRTFLAPERRALWPAAALLVLPPAVIALIVVLIDTRCGGQFVCP